MTTSGILISGTIGFASIEDRDRAVAASAALQQATRNQEPGCLAYVFAADPCEATGVIVYEHWESEAALAAHFEHPNYHDMRTLLRTFERSGPSQVVKFELGRSAPVYDGSGQAQASF